MATCSWKDWPKVRGTPKTWARYYVVKPHNAVGEEYAEKLIRRLCKHLHGIREWILIRGNKRRGWNIANKYPPTLLVPLDKWWGVPSNGLDKKSKIFCAARLLANLPSLLGKNMNGRALFCIAQRYHLPLPTCASRQWARSIMGSKQSRGSFLFRAGINWRIFEAFNQLLELC